MWLLAPALFALFAPINAQGGFYDEEIQIDVTKHDIQFFKYVTRPDLDVPRWNITVYNESAVAPGYWLVAPYGVVKQTRNDNAYVAPHIYDAHGELVWSGALLYDKFNTFSFSAARINGEDMLTLLYPRVNEGHLIDSSYEIFKKIPSQRPGWDTNMHEFQVVDNGTKSLFIVSIGDKSVENTHRLGIDDDKRKCELYYQGLEERNIETGEVTFTWSARDVIDPEESYMWKDDTAELCEPSSHNHPDYMHLNSAEKLPSGDYLVSSRRTWTIYKVTKEGEIEWRLGGKNSDFTLSDNLHFSGQHDVRCLQENSTHMLISFLDNAKLVGAYPETTNDESRGLVVSVDLENKYAELVIGYDHPTHEYAAERGNTQTLPNGNVIIFWTDLALNSEYTADGKLVKVAQYPSGLKTYRGYKLPWVGLPNYPPDVHSQIISLDGKTTTAVHVSWNGATEVATWNLYATDHNGNQKELLMYLPKTGFETAMYFTGDVAHVVVEGLDSAGKVLGESKVFNTIPQPHAETNNDNNNNNNNNNDDIDFPSNPPPSETETFPDFDNTLSSSSDSYASQLIFSFIGGVVFTAAAGASFWFSRNLLSRYRERRKKAMYSALRSRDEEDDHGESFHDSPRGSAKETGESFSMEDVSAAKDVG